MENFFFCAVSATEFVRTIVRSLFEVPQLLSTLKRCLLFSIIEVWEISESVEPIIYLKE